MRGRRDILEFCHVEVDCEGRMSMRYQWAGLAVAGSMSHDEDVSEWTDQDIINCACNLIDISHKDDRKKVTVTRV